MKIFIFLFSITSLFSFEYDVHKTTIPGSPRTMVCFHGYGADYRIAGRLKRSQEISATLVAFNFPDHDILKRKFQLKASFGTIDELLPALSVLKSTVLDEGLESVDLYGHSAGGGAIINLIATLNTSSHDRELKKIGIEPKQKKALLEAIEKGLVILDTPLKSIEEVIALRGSSFELELLAKQYQKHNFRPIDSIDSLKGLSLNLLIFFQLPDEILDNRDDQVFIEKLTRANQYGKTTVVISNDGGHMGPHPTLWKRYQKLIESN